MPHDDPETGPSAPFPFVSVVVVLTFLGLGVGYALWPEPKGAREERSEGAQIEMVSEDALYYVFVEMVEFSPTRGDGEGWDIDDSAPDLAYTLNWKGQQVFQSTEVSESLIARWSGLKIGVSEAMNLLQSGKADPGQIIDAALVRAQPGGSITITFVDGDLSGEDRAGVFTLPFATLKVGRTLLRGRDENSAVERASLRVVPGDRDLFQTLKALSSEAK